MFAAIYVEPFSHSDETRIITLLTYDMIHVNVFVLALISARIRSTRTSKTNRVKRRSSEVERCTACGCGTDESFGEPVSPVAESRVEMDVLKAKEFKMQSCSSRAARGTPGRRVLRSRFGHGSKHQENQNFT
jgi:hypothetical protein